MILVESIDIDTLLETQENEGYLSPTGIGSLNSEEHYAKRKEKLVNKLMDKKNKHLLKKVIDSALTIQEEDVTNAGGEFTHSLL